MATTEITPTPNAESSPAPDVKQFHEFTGEERSEYLKTLKTPEVPKETPTAPESAPADAPKEETSAAPETTEEQEAQPEPEAGKESQEPKPKKGAEARIKELVAERNQYRDGVQTLKQEMEQLREEIRKLAPKDEKKAESSSAPAAEAPKKPKFEDFNGDYAAYEAAKDDYYEKLVDHKAQKLTELLELRRQQEEVNRVVAAKIQEAKKLYSDFDPVVKPVLESLTTGQLSPLVSDAIGRSPNSAHILYVIGKDPADLHAFAELAQRDPVGAVLKVGIYEQLIKAELEKAKAAPATPEKVPAKPVTSAPPPPTEIGGKMQKAADPLEQALKEGDVQAYRRELNRQARLRAKG